MIKIRLYKERVYTDFKTDFEFITYYKAEIITKDKIGIGYEKITSNYSKLKALVNAYKDLKITPYSIFRHLPDKVEYNCEVGYGPKVMQELECANNQIEVKDINSIYNSRDFAKFENTITYGGHIQE